MTTSQDPHLDKLRTCALLFMELQAVEPLLGKNRRVFITRNHRSAILFRITSANGDKVLFSRTFAWADYNTLSAIRDVWVSLSQDLRAANLILSQNPNS